MLDAVFGLAPCQPWRIPLASTTALCQAAPDRSAMTVRPAIPPRRSRSDVARHPGGV